MENHIRNLNNNASIKWKYVMNKKRKSGRILLNLLYDKIGIYLPHDMCYEISSYLVYDIRTVVYKKVFQRNQYLYLYKEILQNSLQLMSRFYERNVVYEHWYVTERNGLLPQHCSNYNVIDCMMFTVNCSVCGNYLHLRSNACNQKIMCSCFFH